MEAHFVFVNEGAYILTRIFGRPCSLHSIPLCNFPRKMVYHINSKTSAVRRTSQAMETQTRMRRNRYSTGNILQYNRPL
jgi:hypothetical protein